jgi:hypothetical protein
MIKGLLNQTITIYSKTGFDAYGRESVGTATTAKGRMEVGNKNYLKPNGETVTIDAILFLGADVTISIDDKVNFNSVNYKVTYLNKIVGGSGSTDHLELALQQWGAQ